MRELVRGYYSAVAETAEGAGHVQTLGDELALFLEALRVHDDLRQVLTDPALSAAARRGVVEDLLVGRGLEETSSLVSFVLRAERPSDVPVVLGQLVAASRAAIGGGEPEDDKASSKGGRSVGKERLKGYAERVLQELASPGEIDEVEDELFRFARLLDGEDALRSVLADTTLPVMGRLAVLDDLLMAKVRPATLRLGRFVLHAGRLRDLVGLFEWLVELAAAERGRRVAEVRSAVDLDAAERDRLAAGLGRLVGRTVEVRVVIDPSVVGGMLVAIGDLIIDGTIRLRLERLRDALAGSS